MEAAQTILQLQWHEYSPKRYVPEDANKVDLQAFIVEPAVLSGVLFGNPLLHKMTEYLSRVSSLGKQAAEGEF